MIARAAIFFALLVPLAWPRAAAADDREKAAEHFALAEAAEKRSDWRSAIDEYERAYAASPHPAVLYNIGANYERLDEGRSAASYFRRYLDEVGDAGDREQVEQRIEALRQRPSEVTVEVAPEGATVYVGGAARGEAPVRLSLDAGRHEIYAAHRGRTSEVREVAVEFGEPVSVTIDLDAATGVLIVASDVPGAEVLVDGKRVGSTPFSGLVAAGSHEVLVARPGHRSARRTVEVPAEGSEQIRVSLQREDGAAEPGEDDGGGYVLDMGYGFDSAHSGLRYLIGLAWRPGPWQVGLVLGKLNDRTGGAFGVDGRVYLSGSAVRPYARAGIIAYRRGATESASSRFEAGAGIMYAGQPAVGAMAIEYFLELDGHLRMGAPIDEDDPYVGLAAVFGLGFRFGGQP